MGEEAEGASEPATAALFRQWLESFGALEKLAPWASLQALGEALQQAAQTQARSAADAVDVAGALRELLRDFRARLDALLEVPEPPAVVLPTGTFPMLGPAREWQLALESLWQSWTAERAAAAALQRADWRVLSAGLASFEASLAAPDPLPDTLFELHARLVSHCETAHQQALREDAYVAAFGAHTNAALRLGEALAAMAERGLPRLGMPRPSELQALESRLAALESKLACAPSAVSKPARRRASTGPTRRAGPG